MEFCDSQTNCNGCWKKLQVRHIFYSCVLTEMHCYTPKAITTRTKQNKILADKSSIYSRRAVTMEFTVLTWGAQIMKESVCDNTNQSLSQTIPSRTSFSCSSFDTSAFGSSD